MSSLVIRKCNNGPFEAHFDEISIKMVRFQSKIAPFALNNLANNIDLNEIGF